MSGFTSIDYLLVGHVCHDITPEGLVPGGTAVYSTLTAQALGCRVAVLTSAGPDYELDRVLPSVDSYVVPSGQTTTFENLYTPSGRRQNLHAIANRLTADHLPRQWQRAPIVHLGPIANEVDPAIVTRFSNSLVGITPQGWFRRWKDDGRVYADAWQEAAEVLPFAAAVILSLEDLPHPGWLEQIVQWAPLVVLTQQSLGCTVFCRDERRQFEAPSIVEVNPTGAGDIFATAFLVRLHQTKGNPWEAAEFANQIAAQSVAHDSLEIKLNAIKELHGSLA